MLTSSYFHKMLLLHFYWNCWIIVEQQSMSPVNKTINRSVKLLQKLLNKILDTVKIFAMKLNAGKTKLMLIAKDTK